MERYTKKSENGGYCINSNCIYEIFSSSWEKLSSGPAIKRLAEYEDAQEQGLLLRLPCKVGTPVYAAINKKNYGVGFMDSHIETWNFRYDMIPDFGKTIFLTREAAESALREITGKGGMNDE